MYGNVRSSDARGTNGGDDDGHGCDGVVVLVVTVVLVMTAVGGVVTTKM